MDREHDFKKFSEIFKGIYLLFGEGKNLHPALIEIYYKSLERFTIAEIEIAIKQVINTRVFSGLPKPAEIIQAIESKDSDTAIIALELVIYAVEHIGNYTSVKFTDPVIHSVIEMLGGWPKFCTATEEEWVWLKKDFLKFYPTMAKKQSHSDYLPGQFEIDNVARGSKWNEKPKLITIPQPHKRIEQPKTENKTIKLEEPKLRPVQDLVMSTFDHRRAA